LNERNDPSLQINDMISNPSHDTKGQPFDPATIAAVWAKAMPSSSHPPLRLDPLGALIWKEGYGNTSSKFGWEIGYQTPPANGGGDTLDNLVPLQWENSRRNAGR